MKKNVFKNPVENPEGYPRKNFEKFVFNKKVYIFIPIEVVFYGDYEYGVILVG
jgi:hypothetical protein